MLDSSGTPSSAASSPWCSLPQAIVVWLPVVLPFSLKSKNIRDQNSAAEPGGVTVAEGKMNDAAWS